MKEGVKPGAEVVAYQLKVAIRGTKPLVWRRILMRGDSTLGKLHRSIQTVMPWQNQHLHAFEVGSRTYGEPCLEADWDVAHEKRVKLSQVVARGIRAFVYEYDFGDGWCHDIVLERTLPLDPDIHYPVCLAGKNACPPEDCGGIGGYYDLLRALKDPHHPEHEEMLMWLGGDFDPHAFDVELMNFRLRFVR